MTGTSGLRRAQMAQGMIRIAIVFLVFGGLLLFVFNRAQWHAEGAAVARYCDNPDGHVALVGQILTEENPAGEEARRPWIIAAKLIYLIPQQVEEPLEEYLLRLRQTIGDAC